MKILMIDIETMAMLVYAWSLFKTTIPIQMIEEPARMICFAAKFYGEKKKHFYSEHHHSKEEMLSELWELIDKADVVMHFNGTRFDMRHINREFLLANMPPPSPYTNLDLLKEYRKHFLFPSNKLDYLAGEVLGEHKLSHSGWKLWKACASGCPKSWATMKRYNLKDVDLLEPMYEAVFPWLSNPTNIVLYTDPLTDKPTCPRCNHTPVHKNKDQYIKGVGTYILYRCPQCKGYSRSRTTQVKLGEGVLKSE